MQFVIKPDEGGSATQYRARYAVLLLRMRLYGRPSWLQARTWALRSQRVCSLSPWSLTRLPRIRLREQYWQQGPLLADDSVHAFVRPTTAEPLALKHDDIVIETEPNRLSLAIRSGKRGSRLANTLTGSVKDYEQLRNRYLDVGGDDYIFLPRYTIKITAARILQRKFNLPLGRKVLRHDAMTNSVRCVYSLRHSAFSMRIILSHDHVNISNLVNKSGTSINQIERFYAQHLLLSREMAKNR